jgi:hypothetical protein
MVQKLGIKKNELNIMGESAMKKPIRIISNWKRNSTIYGQPMGSSMGREVVIDFHQYHHEENIADIISKPQNEKQLLKTEQKEP